MSDEAQDREEREPSGEEGQRGSPLDALRGQRLVLACALALLSALLVMAARMERADPVDASERIGRRLQLTELIVQEQERNAGLEEQLEQLAAQIAEYQEAAAAGSEEVAELQRLVGEVAPTSGHTDVRGPGLAVTLTDSTLEFDGEGDPNDFVIHEEDLLSILNALWAGGAEAISINGSRVLSTSVLRCVGNNLYINGRQHVPPFEIQAIGDPADLRAELDRDAYVQRFRRAADEFRLGYEVDQSEELLVPAAPGTTALNVAEPAGDS